MIKKNILSIALLSVLGLSQAAEVENLKTISYLNEPLRLHADVLGEGKVDFAAPTEYLRLNHPIPGYDLSINIVESAGKRELIVTTTEPIDVPVLTLLLESRDSENRKQLFELPILLDFKPDPVEEMEGNGSEIVINGVNINAEAFSDTTSVTAVDLADVPSVDEQPVEKIDNKEKPKETINSGKSSNKKAKKVDEPKQNTPQEKNKPATEKENKSKKSVAQQNVDATVVKKETANDNQKKLQEASDALTAENNNALIKRYGPVVQGETLWSIANKVRSSNTPPQKMIEIIKKNNPSAFTANGVLRANAVLIIPGETAKVQSNFVKSQDSNDSGKVRVGFIYELPAPPVAQIESSDDNATVAQVEGPDKSLKSTENMTEAEVAEAKTAEAKAAEAKTAEAKAAEAKAAEAKAAEAKAAEAKAAEAKAAEAKAAEAKAAEAKAAEAKAAEAKAAEAKAAEAVAVVEEPVKKRPVFVMPEPEPEPGIVELLFDNIVYIGAGAAVLILAALAVVMRRRKKDGDDVKPPKKEQKTKGLGNKKKDEDSASEGSAEPKKKGFSLFGKKKEPSAEQAPVEKPKKKAKGLLGKKKHKGDELSEVGAATGVTAVREVITPQTQKAAEDPIFEDFVAQVVPEDVIESVDDLDFDLSSLEAIDDAVTTMDATSAAEAIEDLDFDLSSLEQIDDEVKVADEPIVVEDFDLSSLGQNSDSSSSSPELTALDFDISLDNIDDIKVGNDAEDFGNLDFDLSFEELVDDKSAAPEIKSESQALDGLTFDLSDLELSGSNEESIDDAFDLSEFDLSDATEKRVDDVFDKRQPQVDDDFGENNPLFSSKGAEDKDAKSVAEQTDSSNEDSAYVSFSDLMESAETEVNINESNESVNFTGIDEDDEAKLANLFEASARDDADAKLDFSFVAEAEDVDASQSFLDSINLSDDEESNVDVIGDSVKDNIAKTEESITEISNSTPPVVSAVEDAALVEPVIVEVPEIEETILAEPVVVDVPEIEEVTLVETVVIDTPTIEEVTLVEPVVIEEPEVEKIVDDVSLIESPVVETPNVQVQEKIVEKVVEVERPVAKADNTLISGLESSDDDNESEQIKLELAVAYMDFDKNLAKPLLEEVIQDGSVNQIAKAKELLGQMD